MKQYAQTILLKDSAEIIARYEEYHRRIWPEVQKGLRDIGITQMVIWRLGRRLFMLMETVDDFDPERDFPRYIAAHSRHREWEELMKGFQEPVPEATPGEWWARMDEVFRLNP